MEYGKNQDGIGKKELLAVSFGTSYRENLALTIEAVEGELSRAFSDYDLRRAFTSPTILRILKERDGLWIDSVEEALERAVQNGVEKLVIQPTHLMHGLEYQGLMRMIETYRSRIPEIVVGEPLFASMEDIWETLEAVREANAFANSDANDLSTAITANANYLEEDGQGRVRLPAELAQMVGIKKDIVFVGKLTYLEVWPAEVWDARYSVLNPDNLAKVLDRLKNLGV